MPQTSDFMVLYGLLACIAIYLIIKFLNKSALRSRKSILLQRYKELRLQSLEIQKELSNHILSHNADRQVLAGEITCGEYLKRLKHNHVAHLSSKLQEKLQNTDNPLLIKKTLDELDEQQIKLEEARKLLLDIHVVSPSHNLLSGI